MYDRARRQDIPLIATGVLLDLQNNSGLYTHTPCLKNMAHHLACQTNAQLQLQPANALFRVE